MKLLNLFKKDKQSIAGICEKAINSFPFNYQIAKHLDDNIEEIPFSKAIKCISPINVNMHKLDYYA